MDADDNGSSQTDDFQILTESEQRSVLVWTPSSWQHVYASDNSGSPLQRPDRGSRSQTSGSNVMVPRDSDHATTMQGESDNFVQDFSQINTEALAGMLPDPNDELFFAQMWMPDLLAIPTGNDNDCIRQLQYPPEPRRMEADPSANIFMLSSQQSENEDRIRSPLPMPQTGHRAATNEPATMSESTNTAATSGPLANPSRALPSKGKRKRFSAKEREDVKRVRKVGACLRCRVMGEKCTDETPCKRCTDVSQTSRVFKGPCWRPSLDEVMTFRAGDSDQGQMRSEIPSFDWCRDGDVRTVSLRFPFEDSSAKSPLLTIECRKFVRKPNHILSETFIVDGKPVEVLLPPYACKHNTDSTKQSMAVFIEECQPALTKELLHSTRDDLLLLSIKEAMRYSALHEDSSVRRALKIRVGAIMNSRYLALTDDKAFLSQSTQIGSAYYFEGTPLPTMVSYVTQCLIAKHMIEEQGAIIKDLKQKILKGNAKNKNWYEVFLTTFVLLATVEYVYQKQKRYLGVKEGATSDSITNVKFISKKMLQEWEYSAQNLIVHFRCALRGSIPFSLEWEPTTGNIERAGLDKDALLYVKTVQQSLRQREEELVALREEGARNVFDKPLVWIAELFRFSEDD